MHPVPLQVQELTHRTSTANTHPALPSMPPTPTNKQAPQGILSCMLLNTRSLSKEATEVWDQLDNNTPDILFLTETWLIPASGPDIAKVVPSGYKIA